MKQTFIVAGLTGPACGALIEKHIRALDGVKRVRMDISNARLRVHYEEAQLSADDIISEVAAAGYIARREVKGAKARNTLIADLIHLLGIWILTLAILYLSFSEVLGLPVPQLLSYPLSAGVAQLLLLTPVMYLCRDVFTGGLRALRNRSSSMLLLASLGSLAALIYSCLELVVMAYRVSSGTGVGASLYFDSAALIPALVELGQYLELAARGHTSDALQRLKDLRPETACVIKNGSEQTVLAQDVQAGDTVIVRKGGIIPCDGTVSGGSAMVDASVFSGSAVPVAVKPGDSVNGASVCLSGELRVTCAHPLGDMRLSRILSMAGDAALTRAPISLRTDRVIKLFVPLVVLISLLAGGLWLYAGMSVAFAVKTCVCVLVISCPCAMGLATPTAIMAGTGCGAESGIMVKSAAALEQLGSIDTVVFHAPGTLSEGGLKVCGCVLTSGTSCLQLVSCAASALSESDTPEATAVREEAARLNAVTEPVSEREETLGMGVRAGIGGKQTLVGNLEYMRRCAQNTAPWEARAQEMYNDGCRVLFIASEGRIHGLLALRDALRPDSAQAVEKLKALGVNVIMLSDDTDETASAVAAAAGITDVKSRVTPESIEMTLRLLKADGHKVLSVFGESTFADELGKASLSMSVGQASELSVETAQILLLRSDMRLVAGAIELGRKTMRIIRQNLFWAFFYNIIGIPVAAGALYHLTGLQLSPMLAAPLMFAAGLCIVINALRLRSYTPDRHKISKQTLNNRGIKRNQAPENAQ